LLLLCEQEGLAYVSSKKKKKRSLLVLLNEGTMTKRGVSFIYCICLRRNKSFAHTLHVRVMINLLKYILRVTIDVGNVLNCAAECKLVKLLLVCRYNLRSRVRLN